MEFEFGLPDPEPFPPEEDVPEAWEVFPEEEALMEAAFLYNPNQRDERLDVLDSLMSNLPLELAGQALPFDWEESDPDLLLLQMAILLDENWEQL